NFLAWLGVSLLTGHAWFVLLACCFFWIYHERVMFAEEQFLREKFGVIYTRWASRTPAFIPDFRLFVRPVTRFSWRKVARNEKNGVLALFLVFSAFDVAGRWVDGRVGYDRFYATATAVSLLAYLVSRYLKKHTRVLDERSRDKIIAGEL
ncbi:MAG: lipid A phosphate methyltransferase, partial [Odoribacteraceae bacterium]|nr:lipid A phosphate methyltransferase [Odoribacteraceae bacterium]